MRLCIWILEHALRREGRPQGNFVWSKASPNKVHKQSINDTTYSRQTLSACHPDPPFNSKTMSLEYLVGNRSVHHLEVTKCVPTTSIHYKISSSSFAVSLIYFFSRKRRDAPFIPLSLSVDVPSIKSPNSHYYY